MTSINTNSAAMTALRALQQTNKALETTQNRISTGFRVANAEDNAAYWSIATTMRSDNKALSTVKDALGLGAATVDTQYTAMNSAISVVDEIKTKLVGARNPGTDRVKIQSDIKELQNQLKSMADSGTLSGQNWLTVDSSASGYSASKTIVASFTRAADGTVSVGTITVDTSKIKLFDSSTSAKGILDALRNTSGAVATTGASVSALDISALTDSTADLATLDGYIKSADTAMKEMTTAATNLGSAKKRIGLQQDFVSSLMNSIDRGVGQLVDADMSAESTKLQALQVQQQLGVQALSIANSSSQTVLSLFRG